MIFKKMLLSLIAPLVNTPLIIVPLIIISQLITSCTSLTTSTQKTSLNLMSEEVYKETLGTYSQKKQIYSGLQNTMDLTASLLNSKVIEAQTDQYARLYLWDENKYTQEKAKSMEKLNKESEVFISFFTPERKHDDLHKNQTLWKVFLDIKTAEGNKRIEGKAKKIKLLTEEIRGFYPYHTQFATPYSIIFPIPMKQVETANEIKLIITGPVGSGTLDFTHNSQ